MLAGDGKVYGIPRKLSRSDHRPAAGTTDTVHDGPSRIRQVVWWCVGGGREGVRYPSD